MKNGLKIATLFAFICLIGNAPVFVLILVLRIRSHAAFPFQPYEKFPIFGSCEQIGALNHFYLPTSLLTLISSVFLIIMLVTNIEKFKQTLILLKNIPKNICTTLTTKEGYRNHYLRIIGWSLILVGFTWVTLNLSASYSVFEDQFKISPPDCRYYPHREMPDEFKGKGTISKEKAREILWEDREVQNDFQKQQSFSTIRKLVRKWKQALIQSLNSSFYNLLAAMVIITGVILIEIEAYKNNSRLREELQKKLSMFGAVSGKE